MYLQQTLSVQHVTEQSSKGVHILSFLIIISFKSVLENSIKKKYFLFNFI